MPGTLMGPTRMGNPLDDPRLAEPTGMVGPGVPLPPVQLRNLPRAYEMRRSVRGDLGRMNDPIQEDEYRALIRQLWNDGKGGGQR